MKNYIIERQQTGQSIWKKLGDVSADQLTFRDRNVCHGKRYTYRIYAENREGIGDPLETDHIMAGALGKRLKGQHTYFIVDKPANWIHEIKKHEWTNNTCYFAAVFPDRPAPPTIVSAFKNCINVEWAPPEKDRGTKILGYQLEKRKKDTSQWVSLNSINEPIEGI